MATAEVKWERLSRHAKKLWLDQLEQHNQCMREKLYCKVCQENLISKCYKPCGHACVCFVCDKMIKTCPLCRATIKKAFNVSFSSEGYRRPGITYDVNDFKQANDRIIKE